MAEFDQAWKIMQIADSLMGNYIMIEPGHKLSKYQQINRWVWILGFCLPLILIGSTIYAKQSDIALLLQAVTMFEMYSTGVAMNMNFVFYRKSVRKVLDWCRETQALDNVHTNKTRTFLIKLIRRFATGYFLCFVSITIMPIVVGQLLPNDIYPKFRPPQPFELAIEDRDNWTVYLITCFVQCFGVYYGNIFPFIYFSFFATFTAVFYAYLNIMVDDINEIHQMSPTWAITTGIRSNHDGNIWKLKIMQIVDKYCESVEYVNFIEILL